MGIYIKKNKDGGYRRYWQATYWNDGRICYMALDVEIKGKPPASLSVKETGDAAFEKSRGLAQARLDAFVKELKQKGANEAMIEELIASKTGAKVSYHRLNQLAHLWNEMARTTPLSEMRKKINAHTFAEFDAFCKKKFLYQVNDDDVKRYFNDIRERLAWPTVKSRMGLLSGAFSRFLPQGCHNPFNSILKRDTSADAATIHRVPLTNEQVQKVLDTARGNDFLYPLVVCAISTGARLKDICFMRKDNIDLESGFVSYIASKTHTKCELPLFDEFRKVCDGIITSGDPHEPLLFPEAANMYTHNYSGIVHRGKKLFADALFGDTAPEPSITDVENGAPVASLTHDETLALIDKQGYAPSKTQRMKEVYTRYVMLKQSYRYIEKDMQIPRNSIYTYMKEIEDLTNEKIVRFTSLAAGKMTKRDCMKLTRQKRLSTGRSVSIYGWGSFRATFCILAISKHIPEKAIMNAVGHSTFKTTMTYYNNPTRAHLKEAWGKSLASAAIGEETPALATTPNLQQLVDKLTPEQRMNLALLLQKQDACG